MSLTRRIPAATSAEQQLIDAHANLDDTHGRIADLTEANDGWKLENKALAEDLADLSAQALPHLSTPTWPQTDQPVKALIGNELAERFGGWDGDSAEHIRSTACQVCGGLYCGGGCEQAEMQAAADPDLDWPNDYSVEEDR